MRASEELTARQEWDKGTAVLCKHSIVVTGRDRGTGQVGSVLTEQGPGQYHDSAQSGSIHP